MKEIIKFNRRAGIVYMNNGKVFHERKGFIVEYPTLKDAIIWWQHLCDK